MKSKTSVRQLFLSALIAMGIVVVSSCDINSTLETEFMDPDGFTEPTIEGVFTNLQQQLGIFRPSYAPMWHTMQAFNPMLGTGGFNNDGAGNSPAWGFNPYGLTFNQLRIAQNINNFYEELSSEQQQNYEIYVITTEIIRNFLYYRLSDTHGDVPYFEALGAWEGNFFPAYDSQQSIYEDILADLEQKSSILNGYSLNDSQPHRAFRENDIWFGGDLSQWRRFVNSLRMRLSMRLTNVNESLAQSTMQAVLSDGHYVTSLDNEILHQERRVAQDAHVVLIWRTLREQPRNFLWMPEGMDLVMRKDGMPEDPRLPVFFQPDMNGEYTSMPRETVDISALPHAVTQSDLTATYPSFYNRTTFEGNYAMPYQIITAAEIHLLKAEAAMRWGLGLDAVQEYGMAIRTSIDRWYEINAMNDFDAGTTPAYPDPVPNTQPDKPDDATITAFIEAMQAEFTGADFNEQLGLIYDQKYVHFNVLRPLELWAETRRLYTEIGDRVLWKPSNRFFFERMIYPAGEVSNNSENFSAVADANNFTTPLWWTGRSTPVMTE
ncbi:MAG: SusD/RagB family nutrient-binding outer membrane lipoprotein [Balneolaceae bacterium]|nr:SusD/RagB family nutrient-binding outer membrane lipoprotein [Balneolaceae bacterium]